MKYILILLAFFFIQCNSISSDTHVELKDITKGKILFVVSNAAHYGNSDIAAANHFAEMAIPYDVLLRANYSVDFVSPDGGAIPIGYIDTTDALVRNYLKDEVFMQALENTKKPSDVKASDYAAIFYSGGGSAMFGVPENESIQKIAMKIYESQNGVVSALCHGAAGIVHLKTKDGKYLVDGKVVNGYPDRFENTNSKYYEEFPFSIEQIIIERGGDFKYSEKGWDGYYEVDGRLITGQDPTGAEAVSLKIVEALEKSKS